MSGLSPRVSSTVAPGEAATGTAAPHGPPSNDAGEKSLSAMRPVRSVIVQRSKVARCSGITGPGDAGRVDEAHETELGEHGLDLLLVGRHRNRVERVPIHDRVEPGTVQRRVVHAIEYPEEPVGIEQPERVVIAQLRLAIDVVEP